MKTKCWHQSFHNINAILTKIFCLLILSNYMLNYQSNFVSHFVAQQYIKLMGGGGVFGLYMLVQIAQSTCKVFRKQHQQLIYNTQSSKV